MSTDAIEHWFVTAIPATLRPGALYISREYEVAVHLCLCGCRAKVVTSLGPAEWSLTVGDGAVTLSPSVGNGAMGCRSHYEITDSTVQRLPPVTDTAQQRAVERDARDLQIHLRRESRWCRRLLHIARDTWDRLREAVQN